MSSGCWAIVKVKRLSPHDVCTPEQLESSRIGIGKTGYSFEKNVPCEEHADDWIDRFDYDCPNCKRVTITYTDEHRLTFALETAYDHCDRHTDTWVVDGDTREIVAVFRTTVERIA